MSKDRKHGPRLEIKDAAMGTVSAVFSTFNVKDLDGDVTLPDAFDEGAECLISAYGHSTWGGQMPVGRGKIRVDKKAGVAILDGQFFLDTEGGKETFAVVKNTGELQEWSYGFDVLKIGEVTEEMRQAGVRRVIEKARVFEVSPVLLGAGINTQTLDVKTAGEPAPKEIDPAVATGARQAFVQFMKTNAALAVK